MDPSATRSSPSVGGDRGTNPTDPPFSSLGGASWARRTVATFGRVNHSNTPSKTSAMLQGGADQFAVSSSVELGEP
jgi:hypothetical protein